jgi:hypothetical protein
MRTRPILLSKTCPYCGGRSVAEAKLPVPANLPMIEYNLDHLDRLVETQSLGLLLALVELLPYKNFSCRKCQGEFRLESASTKELAHAMLASLRPVLPEIKPSKKAPAKPVPRTQPEPSPAPAVEKEWSEAESLDSLFDYSIDANKKP